MHLPRDHNQERCNPRQHLPLVLIPITATLANPLRLSLLTPWASTSNVAIKCACIPDAYSVSADSIAHFPRHSPIGIPADTHTPARMPLTYNYNVNTAPLSVRFSPCWFVSQIHDPFELLPRIATLPPLSMHPPPLANNHLHVNIMLANKWNRPSVSFCTFMYRRIYARYTCLRRVTTRVRCRHCIIHHCQYTAFDSQVQWALQ